MSQKFFPIKSETACQLKWAWSTVRMYTGTTSSCHRVDSDQLDPETFYKFHNTPKKINDRTQMLDGHWPTGGCEYCSEIEKVGGHSDRMNHLSIPDLTPHELDNDLSVTTVTPTILEIYFDNVCNMSCLYCWDGFSSKIQQENRKFGRFEKNGVIIDNKAIKAPHFDKMTDSLWSWMQINHQHLKRLHILGGEPFYQRQFDQCIDFFNNNPNPELEFNVVSNLMLSLDSLKQYINKFKLLVAQRKIKRFDLTVSIDCFGPEQEYVRYGLNLQQWRQNFEFVVSQRWIYLNIHQTLTSLTIKTAPDMLKYIKSFAAVKQIHHHFSLVVGAELLHPGIFGEHYFSNDFDKILNEMNATSQQEQNAKKYMAGIWAKIKSCQRQPEKIKQLAVYLDEIDRRRNLNWKTIFPWLEREVNSVV